MIRVVAYEIPGWDTTEFDASVWKAAAVLPGPAGTLVNQIQPPSRIMETLSPVSIKNINGVYLAEFERVVSGWARITASATDGPELAIHFGEKLKEDGTAMWEASLPNRFYVLCAYTYHRLPQAIIPTASKQIFSGLARRVLRSRQSSATRDSFTFKSKDGLAHRPPPPRTFKARLYTTTSHPEEDSHRPAIC